MSLFIVKAQLMDFLLAQRGSTSYTPVYNAYTTVIAAVDAGQFDWAGESE